MRAKVSLAVLAATAAVGFSQPASAFDDSHCCGGTVYVHHHMYAAPRYKHVYHLHRPGPRHVHYVHVPAPGCCEAYVPARRNYFYAPRGSRWHWRAW